MDFGNTGISSAFVLCNLREHRPHHLSIVVTQEDTSEHKPSPAPLFLAAEKLETAPECCVYVGDQPTDIQAAQAAGMGSIATYWGEGRKERLVRYQPTFSCENPIELITLALHGFQNGRNDYS